MTKTREDNTQRINEGIEHHDFGVVDKKARKVGADVSFQVQTFVEISAHSKSYSLVSPGTYFCWMGNATRGDEWFGAGQNWNRCKTEVERFEQVAKYLKGAKARAVKTFG